LVFSLAMLVAIVVPFILTLMLSKTKFAAKFAPED
jgi:trehalose PTS system EIIBC or EIIBCA component